MDGKNNCMRYSSACYPMPRSLALLGLCLTFLCQAATAGDWPQILGPERNTVAQTEQLEAWPAAGPPLVWQAEIGHGLAGVAVVGKRLVLWHRMGNELLAEGRDALTGKKQWQASFPTRYVSTISSDDGPRCVPLVHQDRVFMVGPSGELACVQLETGKKLWYRDAYKEFRAPEGYFGAGSSPIVEGGKLILNVGGADGAGLVAFDLADGKTAWKATSEAASYSSPVAATLDGVRHLIFVTRLNVVSVDPDNGQVRFKLPFGARGPTVNAANPLVIGDHLFLTSSYGVGARWIKFAADEATVDWESDDVMSSQYSTCALFDGLLYGIDGRQDVGTARLRCFDPRTSKVRWTEEGYGTGNLILAGDKLLVLKTDGQLELVQASPAGYRRLAETKLFDTTAQALPALAGGHLWARDTKTLKCIKVGNASQAR